MNQILRPPSVRHSARWPGFDWDFFADASDIGRRTEIRAKIDQLGLRHTFSGIKPTPFAPPVLITKQASDKMQAFCHAYHRLIETIVSRYQTDTRLQQTISLPPLIAKDALRNQTNVKNKISLCRVDFYLHGDGGFSVLETNANCPGLLIYAGIGAAFWRTQMPQSTPAALPAECPTWFSDWYLQAAKWLSGTRPERVSVFCQEVVYSLEIDEVAAAFRSRGVTTTEIDPRHVARNATPNHGYLKLSIPEFARMRAELNPFLDAILAGDLFVQNGLLGRWIGDNKLCLAILSDPTFADLFDPSDLDAVRPHIPWSRNIAQCDPAEIKQIRNQPSNYVLKRPLDTRGRGVIVGREVTCQSEWATAVTIAINEAWLVMRHVEPTYITSDPNSDTMVRHDLALGLIDGSIASGFVRSSPEYRVNVALNGRLHPIFLEH
ncbi:MAG: hypothetical protein ACTSX7_01535 [Alphaproteobacteria bacterium]